MRGAFLAFFIFLGTLFSATPDGKEPQNTAQPSQAQSIAKSFDVSSLIKELETIDRGLRGNVWITRYLNYNTYQNLKEDLASSEYSLKSAKDNKNSELIKKIATLKEQISMLKEYEETPFSSILQAPEIDAPPRITNPIALISGFSYIKKLRLDREEFERHINDLANLILTLEKKQDILSSLLKHQDEFDSDKIDELKVALSVTKSEISEFNAANDIVTITHSVYDKKVEELVATTTNDIKSQLFSMANIAVFIIASILISFLCKIIAKRTMKDKERIYTFNKFINFINFSLIILILLFAYIENVSYLVTVLGFASAGIAIAMKDMFMSMLGWAVVVFGGTFHVGDRVKVSHAGHEFVGDIIDISLLRMTIFEDITLTTYTTNRRSGRIVFVPNNYIFTELICNYTHSGLKTVWDGIDVLISFESNYKKAAHLAHTIAARNSKGITESARRQMNKLRDQYSLRNPLIEPRVFTFVEPYGIKISVWYMTDSYATLKLRSTIGTEIIDAFKAESDISISYPAQNLYLEKKKVNGPASQKETSV
ncbi:mechanosensitive ion channel family protein [Campylobacter sp. 19-13652]|uniref:mechanosensitive ion channel family protein n=1 Tax=Campylobacter sp. 19-13652 TaxID=2840180 RepID=UPI001C776DE3|nr:mechanosensitive ion channel domain-containing protein [Campylobacter sp. 19-13652]BCX79183.1 membrane protein [Campylobacter sp. 19-13652]